MIYGILGRGIVRYWGPIYHHRTHAFYAKMTVTAYIPYDPAVGQTGITASGVKAKPLVTAAGPRWLPFGTRIWIKPLHRWFTVQDRGGGIHGHHIDLCMSTTHEALQWGVRTLAVKIKLPSSRVRKAY